MAGTLSIVNNFSLLSDGIVDTGKQGAIADVPSAALQISVNGTMFKLKGTLPTASIVQAYTAATDFPATFSHLFFWSDQTCYIQIVGTATNAILKVLATDPFVLPGFGSILAAANTTNIAGGSEPAVTAVSKIVLGNYSGTTMNYLLALMS